MKLNKLVAAVTLSGVMALPISMMAQSVHDTAKAQQEAQDKHSHNKAKIVGGSAAGGAATGALVGGPVGAVVGAGVGAGGGLIANKARKHNGIKKKSARIEQ